MGNINSEKKQAENLKRIVKSKKLHVEIAPVNWKNITAAVDAYNSNPDRVTPAIKSDHVINEALDRYLGVILKKSAGRGIFVKGGFNGKN